MPDRTHGHDDAQESQTPPSDDLTFEAALEEQESPEPADPTSTQGDEDTRAE